jgi:hypothetical protein
MLVLLSAPPALALDTGGEAYQSVLIDSALRAKGLVPEPAPAGKRIARVDVVNYDLILPYELGAAIRDGA